MVKTKLTSIIKYFNSIVRSIGYHYFAFVGATNPPWPTKLSVLKGLKNFNHSLFKSQLDQNQNLDFKLEAF
jgi:hypothetical protein